MTTTLFEALAAVPTERGSRYLQQVCKHWSHSLEVTFDAVSGTINFPKASRGAGYPADALVTLHARTAELDVRILASSPEQRDRLKDVIARHLDRFAFKEAPLPFQWREI